MHFESYSRKQYHYESKVYQYIHCLNFFHQLNHPNKTGNNIHITNICTSNQWYMRSLDLLIRTSWFDIYWEMNRILSVKFWKRETGQKGSLSRKKRKKEKSWSRSWFALRSNTAVAQLNLTWTLTFRVCTPDFVTKPESSGSSFLFDVFSFFFYLLCVPYLLIICPRCHCAHMMHPFSLGASIRCTNGIAELKPRAFRIRDRFFVFI